MVSFNPIRATHPSAGNPKLGPGLKQKHDTAPTKVAQKALANVLPQRLSGKDQVKPLVDKKIIDRVATNLEKLPGQATSKGEITSSKTDKVASKWVKGNQTLYLMQRMFNLHLADTKEAPPQLEEISDSDPPEVNEQKQASNDQKILEHKNASGLNKQKQDFMAKNIDPKLAGSTYAHFKQLPVMQACVKSISANYERWTPGTSEKELAHIQKDLQVQHSNLQKLEKMISELSNSGQDLKEITSDEFMAKFADVIDGKTPITDEKAIEIKNEIGELLKQKTSDKEIGSQKNVISSDTIKKQAALFEASRKGQAWAAGQEKLSTLGKSTNEVYKLQDVNDTTVAFFKQGVGDEKASAVMEKLIYDISLIFGSDQFVATKMTSIRDKTQLEGGTEKGFQFGANGELMSVEGAKTARQGGIQVAQDGISLGQYIDDPSQRKVEIKHDQFVKGSVATFVFGMFDAHSDNIIVDNEGNLKFFDNTRSMPNSNGAIKWGSMLLGTFRSGLLCLPESYEQMSDADRKLIQSEIENYEKKLPELEKFIKSQSKQINSLPPGWFDSELALNALKERIGNLKNAINRSSVSSMRDLVMSANPDYKFHSVLNNLNHFDRLAAEAAKKGTKPGIVRNDISLNNYQMYLLEDNDNIIVSGLILGYAEFSGKDIQYLKNLCDDPDNNINDIIRWIAINSVPADRESNLKKGKKILNQQTEKAAYDFKDLSRDSANGVAFHIAKNKVAQTGLKHGVEGELKFTPSALPIGEKFFVWNKESPPKLILAEKVPDGQPSNDKLVDYLSKPGKLLVDGKEI